MANKNEKKIQINFCTTKNALIPWKKRQSYENIFCEILERILQHLKCKKSTTTL
jgi:hypothetical protein